MHIDLLAIPADATDGRRHHDQRVLVDKVPDAALRVLAAVRVCVNVEFDRR